MIKSLLTALLLSFASSVIAMPAEQGATDNFSLDNYPACNFLKNYKKDKPLPEIFNREGEGDESPESLRKFHQCINALAFNGKFTKEQP